MQQRALVQSDITSEYWSTYPDEGSRHDSDEVWGHSFTRDSGQVETVGYQQRKMSGDVALIVKATEMSGVEHRISDEVSASTKSQSEVDAAH